MFLIFLFVCLAMCADVKLYSKYDSLLLDKLLIVTRNGLIYNYDLKYQQIRWVSELGVSLQSDGIVNGTYYIKPHRDGSFLFYDDVFYVPLIQPQQIHSDDLDVLFKTCEMFQNSLTYKTELIYFLDIATGNIKQLTQYDIQQLLSQPKLYEKGVLIHVQQKYISDLEYEDSQQHNSRIQINFLLKYLRGDQTQIKYSNSTSIYKTNTGIYVNWHNKTLDLHLDDDVFEVFGYTPDEGIFSIIINYDNVKATGLIIKEMKTQDSQCEFQEYCTGQETKNSTAIGVYKASQFKQCLNQFYKVKFQNEIMLYQQESTSEKIEQCEKVENDLSSFLMILLLCLFIGYISIAFKKNKSQIKIKEKEITVVKEVQYVHVKQKEIQISKQKLIGTDLYGANIYEGLLQGKMVTVKEINLAKFSIPENVIQDEITNQMKLSNPHLVKYLFFEKNNDHFYIAMEKYQINLRDFAKYEQNTALSDQQKYQIKQKIQNSDFKKEFLNDLLQAIQFLNAQNIMYKGILPENIVFNEEYKVKLVDIGLSALDNCSQQNLAQQKKTFVKDHSIMRQLGQMFYFMITKGDEIYLKKSLDENILKEKLKKMNIAELELQDIVGKLILDQTITDPKNILQHPYFWKKQRKLAFICEFSDYVETFPLPPDALSLQDRSIQSQVFKDNWGLRCSMMLKFQIRGYDQTQAQQLIRLIRNTKNHYHQLPEECKLLLGPTDETSYNYWNEQFPNLFFTLYQHTLENKLNLLSLK